MATCCGLDTEGGAPSGNTLPNGTVNNSTLRYDLAADEWQENPGLQSDNDDTTVGQDTTTGTDFSCRTAAGNGINKNWYLGGNIKFRTALTSAGHYQWVAFDNAGGTLGVPFQFRGDTGAMNFGITYGSIVFFVPLIFNAGPRVIPGTGDPEGAVTAPIGSLFLRADGGASTTLYVKESGAGNTGWVAK